MRHRDISLADLYDAMWYRTDMDVPSTSGALIEHIAKLLAALDAERLVRAGLKVQRTRLEADCTMLKADCAALQSEHAALQSEHAALQSEHAAIQSEHAALQSDRDRGRGVSDPAGATTDRR